MASRALYAAYTCGIAAKGTSAFLEFELKTGDVVRMVLGNKERHSVGESTLRTRRISRMKWTMRGGIAPKVVCAFVTAENA